MTSESWQRAKDIFNSALELSAGRRQEYLSAACNGDAELHKKIENLINSYESDFMEGPLTADHRMKVFAMKSHDWQKVKAIFNSALAMEKEPREGFLARACGGDTDLLQDVRDMLESYRTDFLEGESGDCHGGSDPNGRFLKPGVSVGHFDIVKLVGFGGMGQVYLAHDEHLDRPVAIKVFSPEFTGDAVQLSRFVREAKAASALNHPNICTIYEIGLEQEPPYIAMEYIDGETLAEKIAQAHLEVDRVIDITIQTAEALAEAHDAGLIHRDIKPANIIVTKRGKVKVVDFGLAKKIVAGDEDRTQKQLSHSGMIIGTVNYMSPEQTRGGSLDKRTDIWSLGIVLFELLHGRSPFSGESTSDVIASILRSEIPLLEGKGYPVSAELEQVLSKALAKDKDDRYPNAREMIADLEDARNKLDRSAGDETARQNPHDRTTLVIDKDTADATRHTLPEAGGGFERRHSRRDAMAVILIVVTLLGLGGAGWLYNSRSAVGSIGSLAVMPLRNETGDPDSEYLSDGITESLIARLSQIPDLSVKARSSVFRYKGKDVAIKDVGQDLSVPGILTGRLRRHGSEYNLYIELVDATTEKVIWQTEYVRPESSLATMPGEIARDVAGKLRQKLSTAEQQSITRNYTDNSAAYELYLKGRYYWDKRNEESFKVAEDAYKQAISLDPNYALAFAGLADLYLFRDADIGRRQAMPRAKQYALKALEIDETVAEAHNTLAFVNENYDFDMSAAEAGFRRAIELKPNYAIAHQFYGGYLLQTGRTDEGLAEVRKALELEPYSAAINWHYGLMLTFARRYDEAIAQEERTLQLQPNYRLAEGALIGAYILAGRFDDASVIIQKHIQAGNNPDAWLRMARLRIVTGNRDEGSKILARVLTEDVPGKINSYSVATVYAALDDKDKTIEWLNRGYDERVFQMFFLRVDPTFDGVRDDPRFQELLRRIGLVS